MSGSESRTDVMVKKQGIINKNVSRLDYYTTLVVRLQRLFITVSLSTLIFKFKLHFSLIEYMNQKDSDPTYGVKDQQLTQTDRYIAQHEIALDHANNLGKKYV